MAKLNGLWKRGNVWHYRVRVPSDLVNTINRVSIDKSLKTKDYRTAISKCRVMAFEFEDWFNQVRAGVAQPEYQAEKVLHKTVTHGAQTVLHQKGDSEALKSVIREVVLEVVGDGFQPRQKPSITIKELYERYMADPAANRTPKTIQSYQTVYNGLKELLGEDKQIGTLSRDECRLVLETIRFVPANAKKKFPKKSWKQISEIAKKRGMKPMAPLTINKYINRLSAMLNWAIDEELMDKNPAVGLKVADPVDMKDKRLPFSNHQLRKIFSELESRPERKSEYWVPYIALYSGMRLNEICQMNVEDIQQHEGVWCFNITTESKLGPADKHLKTKASERLIPIHPKLMDLGFMRYLKEFESRANSKLFPDIPDGTTGYKSDVFSKTFSRFLKSIGASIERTSFHSVPLQH